MSALQGRYWPTEKAGASAPNRPQRMGYETDAPLPADLVTSIEANVRAARAHGFLNDEDDAIEVIARATLRWNRAQIDGGA